MDFSLRFVDLSPRQATTWCARQRAKTPKEERSIINTAKSIGAILAGFITVFVLSTATDFVLESLGIFPPIGQGIFVTWMLLVAFVYRSIYTIAGGYVTARLAPNRPMRHAIILGIVGIVAGSIGVVVGWNLAAH